MIDNLEKLQKYIDLLTEDEFLYIEIIIRNKDSGGDNEGTKYDAEDEKTLEDIDRKSKEGKTSYEIIMDKNETKKLSYISSHFRKLGFEVSHCENKILNGNISLFIKW